MAQLTPEQRAQITKIATERATANGTTPELELWKYATSPEVGYSPDQIDEAMGWDRGTSLNWAVSNGLAPAPQGSFNPVGTSPQTAPTIAAAPATGAAPNMQPLSETDKASVIAQAKSLAQQQGTTPEQVLYSYAQQNSISNEALDHLMSFVPGTTQAWVQSATANGQLPNAVKPAVRPLSEADKASIIQQAKTIAGQQNISPEQALYNYAKTSGIPDSDVDTYMGWDLGTTSAWANRNAATPVKSAGELVSSVATPGTYGSNSSVIKPLDEATRNSIIEQATNVGRLQGITPEQALYNYAKTQGLTNQNVDTYMGWPTGTTQNWATNNIPSQQQATTQTTTQAGPLSTTQPAPYQPEYRMPVLGALYQGQQMTSRPPVFNFQSQQPQQPGALTNVISAP